MLASDDENLLNSSTLLLKYYDSQDCCEILSLEYHPQTSKLIFSSSLQITTLELSLCIADPVNCLSCQIDEYFSYNSSFSLLT